MTIFVPTLAFAESGELVYGGAHDIAEEWGRVLSLSLGTVSGALILWTLIFRRDRLMEAQSKWILFLGVCLLPVPLIFLSTAVGMEQSKRVDFCSSCHVMDPFIDDMRDPESDSLAAIHYRNRYIAREQCYNCHTDYGIFGTVEAKLTGLRHVWKQSTKTYELPVEISKPYNYTICLNCHGEAAPFLELEAHHDAMKSVLAGEASCIECHDEMHPPREDRSE